MSENLSHFNLFICNRLKLTILFLAEKLVGIRAKKGLYSEGSQITQL